MGNIFKITPSGNLTVLYSFTGGSDGGNPYAPPVEGTDGNFYGTTWYDQMQGCGTVYKITPSGTFATLHALSGTDGCMPTAPLIEVNDGSFYGTTELGANNNFGEVFRITPSGQFVVIAQFHGTDGGNPYAPVVQGGDGNFYGTASGWGSSSWGTVYKTTGKGVLTALYNFNGNSDGGGPYAGLVQVTDGNFYGAASGGSFNNGTIYRINTQGAFSVVHNFNGTNGANPYTTLLRHTNGFLYGETVSGGTGSECGTHGCGTFYSLNVGLKPFVSLVSTSGKIGKSIGILGQGFNGTTSVSFNGTAANFKIVSETYLTATVPKGATTGFVTVTTPKRKLTSNKKFRVAT